MTIHRRPPLIAYNVQPQGASVVYWAHRPCHTDMFTQGYIGITQSRANKRWAHHKWVAKKNNSNCKRFANALNKYDDIVFDIVLSAKRDYCEYIESRLRPHPSIGWNISTGGEPAMIGDIANRNPMAGGLANKERHRLLSMTAEAIEQRRLKNEAVLDKHKAKCWAMIRREEARTNPYEKERALSNASRSGLTGVVWHWYVYCRGERKGLRTGNGAWRTQFKGKILGYYKNKNEAHDVYLKAKQRYYDTMQFIN
jgi:hypothetical protein